MSLLSMLFYSFFYRLQTPSLLLLSCIYMYETTHRQMALGANVIAIDLDRAPIWERLIGIARKSCGTLTFPLKKVCASFLLFIFFFLFVVVLLIRGEVVLKNYSGMLMHRRCNGITVLLLFNDFQTGAIAVRQRSRAVC